MESLGPNSEEMPPEFAEADGDAELQDLDDALETTTEDLRRLWRDWKCHRGPGSFANPTFFGKTIGGVPAPAVDAYRALEAALRFSGYHPESAWSYNCRTIAGTSSYSLHSYGVAIDLDPSVNPFGHGDPYSGRIKEHHIGAVLQVRNSDGRQVWSWGGSWKKPDRMHFQLDQGPGAVDVDWSTVPGASDAASTGVPARPATAPGSIRNPSPPLEEETMLSQGSRGAAVQRFQQSLKMWDAHALPEHGADGIYGCETNEWVKKYQEEMGVPATGNIDGVTAALLVLENLSRRPGS